MNDQETRELLRTRLLHNKGIPTGVQLNATREMITRDVAQKHAELDKVVVLAKARLEMGTYRYGLGADHGKYDYRGRIVLKLKRYDATGNKEFLVDALNYVALEFNHPNRTDTFFKAIDDDLLSKRTYDV